MMNSRSLIMIVPALAAGALAELPAGPEYDKLSWFLHITDLHISSRAGDQAGDSHKDTLIGGQAQKESLYR